MFPDMSELTAEQLLELVSNANNLYYQRQAESASEKATRRSEIAASISQLETLLADVDGHETEDPTLTLILAGMRQLTETVLNLAHVTGEG